MSVDRTPIHVIKVGGSLLDLNDLPERLNAYCDEQPTARRMMVIGGGAAADGVRDVDKRFGVSEEDGHWLAVRAMELNACCFVAGPGRLMRNAIGLASDRGACEAIWSHGGMAVMQPLAWLMAEEARGIAVPHVWSFTSDSIAAHVARQSGAARLTLLKSASPRSASQGNEAVSNGGIVSVADAAAQGLVDGCFAEAIGGIERVDLVNLRLRSALSWRVQ